MRFFILFLITILLYSCGDKKAKKNEVEGCTDKHAINYDKDANVDDNSCLTFIGKWSGSKKGRIEVYVEFLSNGKANFQTTRDEVIEHTWNIYNEKLYIGNSEEAVKVEWIDSDKFLLYTDRHTFTFNRQ